VGVSDDAKLWFATAPPTLRQRRLSLAAVSVVLVAYAALVPFAALPLPQMAGFIPANEGMIFIAEFVTAVFLLSQFSVTGSRALLLLGSGYLFSALIVIPHALTFPNSFAPVDFLGAGLQTSGWLYIFWHFGFFAAVIGYALLKDRKRTEDAIQYSMLSPIVWSVTIVTGLVCALTWFVVEHEDFLPRLLLDERIFSPSAHYIAGLDLLMGLIALVLLWARQESVLDLWLIVAVCALISELALVSFFVEARFNLGFYSGHLFAVVSSTIVLVALLTEAGGLYAQLLRTFKTVKRERDSKLLSLQAIGGAIAHELNQPITAIALEGNTALEGLKGPPNPEELRVSLNAIVDDAFRASAVLKTIRDLFKGKDHENQPVDGNEIVLEALRVMREELKAHHITTHTDLTPDLPRIMGHKGQLLQVVLNLIHNAIEALDKVKDRDRVVRVETKHQGHNRIAITVEDSGPGIDPEIIGKLFDMFMTTKLTGMGLGLSLCRMIIESHGGDIVASNTGSGARFQIILPARASD
jgi:signal transduction histidine kinase